MKGRLYIKNKRFLINFISITVILFIMIIAFLSGIYLISVDALDREVKGINENTNTELMYRVDEVLEQCDSLAARIAVNDTVRLFYSHARPETLVRNYYNELNSILSTPGISYIDSVILYAPKTGQIFDGNVDDRGFTLEEAEKRTEYLFDITWLEYLNEEERTTTDIIVRSKADIWPYYITVLKQYRAGELEGVVLVNVDLQDLYEHLMAGRNEKLQLFLVDDNQHVIVRNNKKELYKEIESFEVLENYRPGENFGEIREIHGERVAYVQSYSENYGITCVTVNPVEGYLDQITKVQQLFTGGVILAAFIAIALAVIYSVRMEKPMQDIRDLLESASQSTDIKYEKNISDIADQIISYIQMNSGLRKELDAKLDLLKDSQMVALQSQINPHFLFNTLNRISLMIEADYGDRKCIVNMISDLSDILRYSLTEAKTTSIREEMRYIESYISIMKYRYGDFVIRMDVGKEMLEYTIPKLVLQPLVENALQHGIAPVLPVRACSLSISISKKKHRYADGKELDSVCIEIEDNGIGIGESDLAQLRKSIAEQENIASEHIGIRNVAQRFYLLFHKEQEITLESTLGKGTSIRIIFPAVVFEEKIEE